MKTYCTLFISFRLESHLFKADPSVGVKELVAIENFMGRPFVMQFGCKFTGEPPDHGNFGSVIVEQPSQYGGKKSVLSFLLNKVCLLRMSSKPVVQPQEMLTVFSEYRIA